MHSENSSEYQAAERRRASDQPTNAELHKMLSEIHAIVMELKRGHDSTMTAFTTNDLGRPDLDGHRKAHLGMIKAAQIMDNYKTEVGKKVLGYIVAFVIGLVVTGGMDKLRDLAESKQSSPSIK